MCHPIRAHLRTERITIRITAATMEGITMPAARADTIIRVRRIPPTHAVATVVAGMDAAAVIDWP